MRSGGHSWTRRLLELRERLVVSLKPETNVDLPRGVPAWSRLVCMSLFPNVSRTATAKSGISLSLCLSLFLSLPISLSLSLRSLSLSLSLSFSICIFIKRRSKRRGNHHIIVHNCTRQYTGQIEGFRSLSLSSAIRNLSIFEDACADHVVVELRGTL